MWLLPNYCELFNYPWLTYFNLIIWARDQNLLTGTKCGVYRASFPLQLIHSDICGPMNVRARHGVGVSNQTWYSTNPSNSADLAREPSDLAREPADSTSVTIDGRSLPPKLEIGRSVVRSKHGKLIFNRLDRQRTCCSLPIRVVGQSGFVQFVEISLRSGLISSRFGLMLLRSTKVSLYSDQIRKKPTNFSKIRLISAKSGNVLHNPKSTETWSKIEDIRPPEPPPSTSQRRV